MNYRLTIFFFLLIPGTARVASAQCGSSSMINDLVIALDADASKNYESKLKGFGLLKTQFEKCRFAPDSVYAKILHKVGALEYIVHGEPTENSFSFTHQSIEINTSGKTGSDPSIAAKSYNNLGRFYHIKGVLEKSLKYYDTVIQLIKRYPQHLLLLAGARIERGDIFFRTGEYQACVQESTLGINESLANPDTFHLVTYLNQRSQAYLFQQMFQPARSDADKCIMLAQLTLAGLKREKGDRKRQEQELYAGIANAYKVKAQSHEDLRDTTVIAGFIGKAFKYRALSNDPDRIVDDYIDIGVYYTNVLRNYPRARYYCQQVLSYPGITDESLAFGYLNYGAILTLEGDFAGAQQYYQRSLETSGIKTKEFLENPSLASLRSIASTELLTVLLNNKTELLLTLFYKTKNPLYLRSCLNTSLLADSLITVIRHGQVHEQSKLFWRKKTRDLFSNALQASYLSGNADLAFYFMERSRAVILGDKIGELGAASLLPPEAARAERELKLMLAAKEQILGTLVPGTKEYDKANHEALKANEQFRRFTKTLEKYYPAYYQYKYADEVLSLKDLQKYLLKSNQSFVHYFTADTVTYLLAITPTNTRFLSVSAKDFSLGDIARLLDSYSGKPLLKAHLVHQSKQSYAFYKTFFEPLLVPSGRVVICPDNFLLPFEAISMDEAGDHMLLEKYAISYVYSACYLVRTTKNKVAKADFAGFAPGSFQPHLELAELARSGASLLTIASHYENAVVYDHMKSTRQNFLTQLGRYKIVNVYSHARADVDDDEPVLYMYDSSIRLSELQYLGQPATELIILSACETSAGRAATGEGIYSLSRGFSAAGIRSVVSTIWKADELAVYAITDLFHKNLAAGFTKDEALQKAKLEYLRVTPKERRLPYYWANIVMVGDAGAVQFDHVYSGPEITGLVVAAIVSVLLLVVLIKKLRRKQM